MARTPRSTSTARSRTDRSPVSERSIRSPSVGAGGCREGAPQPAQRAHHADPGRRAGRRLAARGARAQGRRADRVAHAGGVGRGGGRARGAVLRGLRGGVPAGVRPGAVAGRRPGGGDGGGVGRGRVALAEEAFGAAVSLGGVGSLAVGGWLMVERGARAGRIAERSAVLFLY